MGLQETISAMQRQLSDLQKNLQKATKGNLSAAQRVRTATISFAKLSKIYRKESVAASKKDKNS